MTPRRGGPRRGAGAGGGATTRGRGDRSIGYSVRLRPRHSQRRRHGRWPQPISSRSHHHTSDGSHSPVFPGRASASVTVSMAAWLLATGTCWYVMHSSHSEVFNPCRARSEGCRFDECLSPRAAPAFAPFAPIALPWRFASPPSPPGDVEALQPASLSLEARQHNLFCAFRKLCLELRALGAIRGQGQREVSISVGRKVQQHTASALCVAAERAISSPPRG